jgi:DNA-binding response OmpR family regulator
MKVLLQSITAEKANTFSWGRWMEKKVLIVEDRREQIVFLANNILRPEGWEVITARDGELGLQKAVEEKPDLIITDLKLPKMHGLDMLEELNKQGYRIPTIVMTFHGSEQTAIRAFRLGAADYLIKPFTIDDIMVAIDRALQGGGAAEATAPPTAEAAALSEKVESQERELQRLKSLLQQHQRALQERGQGAAGADAAQWQALLKDKEATLERWKKQTIAQHQALNRQISALKAQLTEKDEVVATLQAQVPQVSPSPDAEAGSNDVSVQLAERDRALAQAQRVVKALTKTIARQEQAIKERCEEAERLARELHALAAGIQMLGQGLSDQAGQISDVLPGEE